MIQLPFKPLSNQRVTTSIGGIEYTFRLVWNTRAQLYTMDIRVDGVDAVTGINVTSGVDILGQYNLPISNMVAINLANPKAELSKRSIGATSFIFLLTDSEVESINEIQT